MTGVSLAATKRIVARLAACQALLLTNGITLIAVSGLAGHALAPDPRLSTLPITAYVLGAALATLPASFFMKGYGRRAGFVLGAMFGILGAAIGTLALYLQSFALLCVGTFASGSYNAFGQYYRFAAADVASVDFRSRAISLVLAGGIVGGILGPEASKITRGLLEPQFVVSYGALGLFALIALIVVRGLAIPPLGAEDSNGAARPLTVIMRQPAFIVAVLSATVGYAVMNLLMTATPLAMDICRHPFSDSAFVLQWHVIGMFAPSFFTGSLIKRLGVLTVLAAGTAMLFCCVAIALSGVSVPHFWAALVLLGVGWNFLYIGGTTLLTEVHTPAERAKTQGTNDLLVFVSMALSSLASSIVLTPDGWSKLNYAAVPLLLAVTIAIASLWLKQRAATVAAG